MGFLGGNDAPIGDGHDLSEVTGSCQTDLTLETATGKISAVPVQCTNEDGVAMNFSMQPLYLKASRITSVLNNEIQVSATGLSSKSTRTPERP